MNWKHHLRTGALLLAALPLALALFPAAASAQIAGEAIAEPAPSCARTLKADVVALDQIYFWNRLGAAQPHGMIYALKRDVVAKSGTTPGAGNARLRDDKRPRPLVLRMNVGDCLQVTFFNWLNSTPVHNEQVATRRASIRAVGLELVGSIGSDGSWVGTNASSLVNPGGFRTYTWYAGREGTFLLYNGGAVVGGEGDNGTLSAGLFGAVNVEPQGSVWYRSQVTEQELAWATFGTTPAGQPKINYGATYPAGHKFQYKPILKILDGTTIYHSDLTAIVLPTTATPAYPEVEVLPNRNDPFREFTIIFHDEIAAVQAFPEFKDPVLGHTLHSVRDAFAINYGTGGIGAEIFANRLGVGPMKDCTECLYEEFFLTSWAVGDPAMVVDTPANACVGVPGCRATQAFYPDDPSNVYHSYLNDHVKFRNLLAGSDDHHIFHLHAHQWLHNPDGDNSTYLDSQAIGQGTSFTYEIAHEGSGNRNKTAGDSIFHCHFYPHFAQGMWAMWRVHDVIEEGTELDADGRPVSTYDSAGAFFVNTRALPDAEIIEGTPIPAIVPLPNKAMPPMPQVAVGLKGGQVWIDPTGSGNPGYPFYIPGVAGHRPPQPPMDFVQVGSTVYDGGLPRHVITSGTFHEEHTRLSFEKSLLTANAFELNQAGERWELEAMKFHADLQDTAQDGFMASYTPAGASALFEVNGANPIGGAPYADPCLGGSTTPPVQRYLQYKAANIELDTVFNKSGWHFPQQRMLSLWDDVTDFLYSGKPPEPFFIRANTYDCVTYWHTNLVPRVYELDDFQVRTPTDILGQHIHLVKFDVMTADGSANGWNYEDGTLSPEEVRERIKAINALGGIIQPGGSKRLLTAKPHPFPAFSGNPDWLGAQTTVQRWFVDDVLNKYPGKDRTLRTVFTHDHFGPSTHQQTGLYAALVVEPFNSVWLDNENGSLLGVRHDGGPTSWQAVIEGGSEENTYREFLFEFGDFQLAYWPNHKEPAPYNPDTGRLAGEGFDDPPNAINPPGRVEQWTQLLTGKPWVYEKPFLVGQCPGGAPLPCPEAISAQDPGTMVVNYRNEPLALRIHDPATGRQAAGTAGDLSHVYRSNVTRARSELNQLPIYWPYGSRPLTSDVQKGDPFTPLLRAYENDRVQVRVIVGAHEEEHNVSVHGIRWLFEPAEVDSGFRNSQMDGISEQHTFEVPVLPKNSVMSRGSVDFLWKAGAAVDDLWNGTWGILRAYQKNRADLTPLSTNPPGSSPPFGTGSFSGTCPNTAPVRPYDIAAVAAWEVLPGNTLTYNSRGTPLANCVLTSSGAVSCSGSGKAGPLHDPTAMIFVRTADLVAVGLLPGGRTLYNLRPGVPIEPLVLRANSGDCIQVTLRNYLPPTPYDLPGYSLMPNVVDQFNINQVVPSMEVGLHTQLVSYDVTRDDGTNVGFNPVQTVPPGGFRTVKWYAGQVLYNGVSFYSVDTEFGAANLTSSDPLKGSNKGLIGALVIEPKGANWIEDYSPLTPSPVACGGTGQPRCSRASATVNPGTTKEFREAVVLFQTDVNLRYADYSPVRNTFLKEDPSESGQVGLNYRTEPGWFRRGILPETHPTVTRKFDFANIFSNGVAGGVDPQTPVFQASKGQATRFRVTFPGGHAQSSVFGLHGHVWEEEPYTASSTVLTQNNPFSEWHGSQHGHGPTNHFDALLQHGAGGAFGITGDYMFRDYANWKLYDGIWGIFRVVP